MNVSPWSDPEEPERLKNQLDQGPVIPTSSRKYNCCLPHDHSGSDLTCCLHGRDQSGKLAVVLAASMPAAKVGKVALPAAGAVALEPPAATAGDSIGAGLASAGAGLPSAAGLAAVRLGLSCSSRRPEAAEQTAITHNRASRRAIVCQLSNEQQSIVGTSYLKRHSKVLWAQAF
jgi:hypothetical protein